jgi:hypothetical protein
MRRLGSRRAAESRARVPRVAAALAVFSASIFLLFQEAAITGSDGYTVYQVTESILGRGDITVDPTFGSPGRGGDYYSKYGIGLSVIGVIPYAAALPIAALAPRKGIVEQAAVASLMPLISAVLAAALYLLARRLGAGPGAAVLTGFGGVAGTFLLAYTKEFFGEPAVAVGVVLAIERTLAQRPRQAGIALAAATLVRPEAFALAPVLLAAVVWQQGWRAFGRAAVPVAASLAFTLAYNAYRFGSISDTGYEEAATATTAAVTAAGETAVSGAGLLQWQLDGATGLLVHPEKSLFLFAPIALALPFAFWQCWRTNRFAAVLIGGTFAAGFIVAAAATGWAGGWCWGPRHLLVPLAPAIALIGPWSERSARHASAVLALFVLGFAISASTLAVSTRAQQLDRPPPEKGPKIVRQYELLPRAIRYSLEHSGDRGEGNHRRYLSLWQVGATREFGTKGLAFAVPGTVLLGVAALFSGAWLRRSLRGETDGLRRVAHPVLN